MLCNSTLACLWVGEVLLKKLLKMEKNITLERIFKNIAIEYENSIDACIEHLMRKCTFGYETDKDENVWNNLTNLLQNEQDSLRVLGFQLLQGLPYSKEVIFFRLKQIYAAQISKWLNHLIEFVQIYKQLINFEEECRKKMELIMAQENSFELMQEFEEYRQKNTIMGGNTPEDGTNMFYSSVKWTIEETLRLLFEPFDEGIIGYYTHSVFLQEIYNQHNQKFI